MCTWITERAHVMGSGKGTQGWFSITDATVYFDHPYHAPLDHALSINFVNEQMGPSARVAVELSAESARELIRAMQAALDAGETQHILAGEARFALAV